jgi:transposase
VSLRVRRFVGWQKVTMPLRSPCQIVLSADERAALLAWTRPSAQARQVLRARIVLAAADGGSNSGIAAGLAICVDTVRKWRSRYATRRLAGLGDARRSGRPRQFTAVQRAGVTAIACELPADRGMPLSRWSSIEVACEAVAAGIVEDISAPTVRRWLAADAVKPWQFRSWIAPRAPDFAAKAAIVLDLYSGWWDGQPLGPRDYVLCSDEKTSIQARCRCHPTLPPGRARTMRVEHEYERGGALAYLAAWDVHRGKVFGRCEPTTGITPFTNLVDQVMACEPYASADRVFWVVDNGSSHRGDTSIDRMTDRYPNAQLVHTPVHASWLNQCEIYFSVVQRKVVTPNDFYDLTDIENRLTAFQSLYNLVARPFDWKYTKKDLNALLARIAAHDTTAAPTAAA